MQKIILYLRADSIKATVVDKYNQDALVPAIARGMAVSIATRLLNIDGQKYPPELLDFAVWDFVLENDWNIATPVKLRADSVVLNVTSEYTEVEAIFNNTNTDALITALGTSESISLGAELVGFRTGETLPAFLLQFDGVIVRNRRSEAGTGSPVTMPDNYLTLQQAEALVAAAPVREYSIDGLTLWHSTQITADRFYHEIRLDGEPTAAFPLPLSAYQQWLDLGNTGTPIQFINSLKTMNYCGAWVPGDHVLNDAVTHNGNLYVAPGSVSTEPPTGWTLMVSKGDAGESAYQLWLGLGHTGTEEEFIASLKGTDATIAIGTVETVDAGDPAEVENVGTPGAAVFNFKFPRGAKGADGANYSVTQQGTFAGRDAYDDEATPFSYLVIDPLNENDRNVFWKLSAAHADWSTGSPWTGPRGASVNPRGAYNPASTYLINDLVSHTNGNSYVSRTNGNTGNDPSTDTTNWQLSATKGIDGQTGATGQTPKFIYGTFTAANLVAGFLTITHNQGLIKGLPGCITREVSAGEYQEIKLDNNLVKWKNNQVIIDLSLEDITGATEWTYVFGGCATPPAVASYKAQDLPQDWKDSVWSNITGRPALDYDQLNVPVWRVDYNIAEGLGIILTEPISLATTGLDFVITAQPHTPGATGTDMAWKADICRYRAGAAQTAIETITLGAMAFVASGITQTSFQKSLADMLSAEILAGDQLAMIIYPDIAAANRKQTDWMVLSVTIKAM